MSTLPERLHFEDLGGPSTSPHQRLRRYTRVGFRAPLRGEYYVSGAKPAAYRAPNDLTTAYLVVTPLDD